MGTSSQLPTQAELSAAPAEIDPAPKIQTYSRSRPVARGITLDTSTTIDSEGWQRSTALTVDLSQGVRAGYLSSGPIASTGSITEMADKAGAAAAINGDFFDINNSGAPIGPAIANGSMRKSPSEGWNQAVAFDSSGAGRILNIFFDGTVTMPAGAKTLDRLNSPDLPVDGIGAYTPLWGSYPRSHIVAGAARVTDVLIENGHVSSVADHAAEGDIPAGGTELLGREAGADTLAGLAVGDPVSVAYQAKPSDDRSVQTAVGGQAVLVKDGQIQDVKVDTRASRTAIGFSRDGRKMIVLSIDGEKTGTRGAYLTEAAHIMKDRGAWVAMELDGGGSSTLVARDPGGTKVTQQNIPNDGTERPVSNGLAFYPRKGTGRLRSFWVQTAVDPADAPGAAPVAGGRPDRVFSGLTRKLTATPYDESYGPVAHEVIPKWSATGGWIRSGTFHAATPGTARITARSTSASGHTDLQVLGPVQRISATGGSINIADPKDTGSFGVVGYDAHGNTAPIEPADVSLDYDSALLSVKADGSGGFGIAAKADTGATVITATVKGFTASIPVSIGLDTTTLANFDDADHWTAGSARGTATVAPTPDGEDGQGLTLAYDFTQSTATRTAYAIPPKPLGVPQTARAFDISVNGHAKGEWTAFTFVDANGLEKSGYGPYITWNGWKTVEIPVPDGMVQPVTVSRFYTIELAADRQYAGEVTLDNLRVKSAPTVDAPAQPVVRDPLIVQNATVAGRTWRYAVMSDAQFVGREPDSDLVAQARRTLREIKKAKPDFLIIDGDFVDEGADVDFQLAKRILDEELGGKLEYHYVPGNHEVMGSDITTFEKYIGPAHGFFDHKGTRFITLDTSSGTLRGGGFDQIQMLHEQLAAAANDDSISSVVIAEHHPPRDPTTGALSQLGDRKEADLLEQWLADFQRTTGKGAALVGGHVGSFSASRVDGIPYLINGNSGKAPSTLPSEGGFTGWTLIGVDPVSPAQQQKARRRPWNGGPDWISAQVRPHVDSLDISAPATMTPGETATVTAALRQKDRTVPVEYPVSFQWYGDGATIGGHGGIASFDPGTGTLALHRPGTFTLTLVVNGTSEAVGVRVQRQPAGSISGAGGSAAPGGSAGPA